MWYSSIATKFAKINTGNKFTLVSKSVDCDLHVFLLSFAEVTFEKLVWVKVISPISIS